MTNEEVRAELAKYKFYHIIPLSEGVSTPGEPMFAQSHPPVLRLMSQVDFKGKRVLDVGCRDGLFSFEAEKAGASAVLGIDNCLSVGSVEFVIPFLKSKVEMKELSLFDLNRETHGQFDVILFLGVLYHLRYPFLAFKTLSDLLADGGKMIVETGIYADDDKRALLFCPSSEESPYEHSSVTFFNRKGLIDNLKAFGLRVTASDYVKQSHRTRTDGSIVRGTFLCEKDSSLVDPRLHKYWTGGPHKNWQRTDA